MSELANFCEVWGKGYLSDALAAKLSCIEAEAIAGLFDAAGDSASGEQWIRDHAWADQCSDSHCRCDQCHQHTYNQCLHTCDVCGLERE